MAGSLLFCSGTSLVCDSSRLQWAFATSNGTRVAHRFPIQHRHKALEVHITDDGALELYLDQVLRKRREPGREPQYVWTNVELEWEEHHYIEVRYWATEGRLVATVNGAPLFEHTLART